MSSTPPSTLPVPAGSAVGSQPSAWDEALRAAVRVLADTAFERAVEGVREDVWHKGERVGSRTRYNDRLLMFLLKVRDPANFAPLAELGDWQQLRPLEPAPALDRAIERIEQGQIEQDSPPLLSRHPAESRDADAD